MKKIVQNEFNEHVETANLLQSYLTDDLIIAAKLCIDCLNNNGKIILFGNGGSAADAQHIAAELVGRYKKERKGLKAIALTTDTSVITSIANDFGYDCIFSRQIEAIANNGDIVIGISTSGKSKNVISALKLAANLGCKAIGLTGKNGMLMKEICDVTLTIPSTNTPRIQEMHIILGHILCLLIENSFSN